MNNLHRGFELVNIGGTRAVYRPKGGLRPSRMLRGGPTPPPFHLTPAGREELKNVPAAPPSDPAAKSVSAPVPPLALLPQLA